MEYIEPRSVKRLEDEIAELERQELERLNGQTEETDEPEDEPAVQTKPLDKEEETFKKRYSDLRRHTQKLNDRIKELEQRDAERERQSSMPDLTSIEEARAWAEANPKAAEIIKAIATEQVSNIAPKHEEVKAVQEKLDRIKQETRIRKSHPDFDDIVADDEFHEWAESQPIRIQDLIFRSSDADDVIWALDLYKKSKGGVDTGREAAREVKGRGTTTAPKVKGEGRFTESQVQKMSLQEYEKNAQAIEKAMKDGTFIYDLSGAAR